jgi:Ribonuclease G/E
MPVRPRRLRRISRKIQDEGQRERLKKMVEELSPPEASA